jgi:hypothetical protein
VERALQMSMQVQRFRARLASANSVPLLMALHEESLAYEQEWAQLRNIAGEKLNELTEER